MENLQVHIYQQGDEVICRMGDDHQKRLEGIGKTVLEALTEISANLEGKLHSPSYHTEYILEQILALHAAKAAYNHPSLEKL